MTVTRDSDVPASTVGTRSPAAVARNGSASTVQPVTVPSESEPARLPSEPPESRQLKALPWISQLPALGREVNGHSHRMFCSYTLRCIFIARISSRENKRFVSLGFCHCARPSLAPLQRNQGWIVPSCASQAASVVFGGSRKGREASARTTAGSTPSSSGQWSRCRVTRRAGRASSSWTSRWPTCSSASGRRISTGRRSGSPAVSTSSAPAPSACTVCRRC